MTGGLVLGIDAGGTSTRAVVASLDGARLGTGRAGGGNPTTHGVGSACAAIAEAVGRALQGLDPAHVSAGVIGLAGSAPFRQEPGAVALDQVWRGAGLGSRPRMVTDVLVAFLAGTPHPSGTVLVAGTGAVAARVRERALERVADGLGWLLGDEGSAFWLGRAAARAALRDLAADAEGGLLTRLVLTHLATGGTIGGTTGTGTAAGGERYGGGAGAGPWMGTGGEPPPGGGGLPAAVFGRGPDPLGPGGRDLAVRLVAELQAAPMRLATLAPLVSEAAEEGDPVAVAIVREAAERMLSTVSEVREPDERDPIVLAGGVLAVEGPVRAAVRALLAERWDAPITGVGEGAAAAAWLAAVDTGELDGPAATDLHARLVGTAPG
jgi:glucosamine kinase